MEGDNNSHQNRQSAPETSGGIPLLPQPSSWHHETTLLSPINFSDHDQQAQISTDQDFFNMLPNVEHLSPLPPLPQPPPPPTSRMILRNIETDCGFVNGESSGTKRTSDAVQVSHPQNEVSTREVVEREDEQRPPRTRRRRSAQVHNLSERTRRGRINEKIRTLKDLIPNCNKADKASVLTDAIEYIKFLQQQAQVKCTYQSMHVPYYSSCFPMRPMMGMGYGTGLCNTSYSTGYPMLPFPQGLNPFGESGIFLPSASQLQYPSVETFPNTTSQPNMETLPTAATSAGPTTATPSTSVTILSSSFSQGESSSAQIYMCDFPKT